MSIFLGRLCLYTGVGSIYDKHFFAFFENSLFKTKAYLTFMFFILKGNILKKYSSLIFLNLFISTVYREIKGYLPCLRCRTGLILPDLVVVIGTAPY